MSFRHPVPGVNPADYERDISVKLHLKHERTDGRTDGRTDARNRIWCIFPLKYDIWWQ